jgi:type VI secretion system secreted protein Hcp
MKYLLVLAAVLGLVAIGSANSFAATDVYMQYGTIKGDSTSADHPNWIELSSYQFDVSKPVTIGGTGIQESGKTQISAITITKTMDSSSTQLMEQAFAGEGQTVTIDLVKSGGTGQPFTYGEYVLSNAIVSGYSVSSGADVPTESIDISFTKITFTYTPQNPDGSAGTPSEVSWNFATNSSN